MCVCVCVCASVKKINCVSLCCKSSCKNDGKKFLNIHTRFTLFISCIVTYRNSGNTTNAQFYNLCILSITELLHVSTLLPSSGSLCQI